MLIIRERAKCLYQYFVSCSGEVVVPKPFKPATACLQVWKCYSLHNLKFEGETSSADYESVESFPSVLKKLTEENGYLLELVFVADETVVIWKWIPVHMFIHETEKVDSGFKLAKDHFTLLFCCNAAGDICWNLFSFIDQWTLKF